MFITEQMKNLDPALNEIVKLTNEKTESKLSLL